VKFAFFRENFHAKQAKFFRRENQPWTITLILMLNPSPTNPNRPTKN